MIYFLRMLIMPILIIFMLYTACNMRIIRKIDDDVIDELLEDKGIISWEGIVRLPDSKERKELLLKAVAKSNGIKHKKIASFVIKCRETIHVLFGVFLGLVIYLIIKMVF